MGSLLGQIDILPAGGGELPTSDILEVVEDFLDIFGLLPFAVASLMICVVVIGTSLVISRVGKK